MQVIHKSRDKIAKAKLRPRNTDLRNCNLSIPDTIPHFIACKYHFDKTLRGFVSFGTLLCLYQTDR